MTLPDGLTLPLYIFDPESGKFRGHPRPLDGVLLCPDCGRLRHRLDAGWVCISCPQAGRKLIDDQVLIATAIDAGLVERTPRDCDEMCPGRWWQVRKLLRFLRQRSRWMLDLGATEADVDGLPATKPQRKRKAGKP